MPIIFCFETCTYMQIKDCEFLMKYCRCICFFTDPLFLMKTATVAKKRRDECLERPTKLQKPNYFLNNEMLAGKLSCKLLTLEPHLKDRITLV